MVEAVKNRPHDAEINAAAESSRKVGSQGHRQTSTGGSFAKGRGAKSSTDKISTNNSRAQNIVIDIESEDLTYNQARSIRLQIQRDVEQLRNRVRML